MAERAEFTLTTNAKGLELLRRLVDDEEFRRALEADPRGVLSREYGIELPEEELPATVELPPDDELKRLGEVLSTVQVPDPFGTVELPPGRWFVIFPFIFPALPFVPAEEGEDAG